MLAIKVSDLIKATKGTLLNGSPDAVVNSFCTDSRKIKKGDMFVPLVGENFDGHKFLKEVMNLGACGFITSEEHDWQFDGDIREKIVIKVEETLKAFQQTAEFHRNKFDIPVIGVTGSAGKTSTKDMIYEVLSKKYKVLKNEGNLNNQIGLPMTLLNLKAEHEVAVVEMGMSSFGEISTLSKIAKPHISIITNIGLAHIGKLGSRQNIHKAKMEIFDGMEPDGLVCLNGDDGLLFGLKDLLKYTTEFYGLQEGLNIKAYNVKVTDELYTTFNVEINSREYLFAVPIPGMYCVYNALAAICVGLRFKIAIEDIIEALKDYKPSSMRMNIMNLSKEIKLINDAYNANPNSMEEALRVMKNLPGPRKIAVLGDMLELGEWTRQAHIDIGKSVVKNGINHLVALGKNSKYIAEGAADAGMSQRKIYTCDDIYDVNEYIKGLIRDGDVILVKGSRGMKMEGIVDFISGVI